MDPMSGCDISLVLHYRSETVHCSTKDAYTSEITFLALQPWCSVNRPAFHLVSDFKCLVKLFTLKSRFTVVFLFQSFMVITIVITVLCHEFYCKN